MAHENCDNCDTDYNFTPKNARLFMFLDYMKANHVRAKCPKCGAVELIYTTNVGFLRVLNEAKLLISFSLVPDDEIKEGADRIWDSLEEREPDPEPSLPDLPDLPHALQRELYDWFRSFE